MISSMFTLPNDSIATKNRSQQQGQTLMMKSECTNDSSSSAHHRHDPLRPQHSDNNNNIEISIIDDNALSSSSRDDHTDNAGKNHCDNNKKDSNPSSPASPPRSGNDVFHSSSAALGKATLAVLVFYNVSGGPFGVESAVRSGGYLYTLLGFLIGPLLWSAQEALMTAELACVFPESSGGMAWVEEAFGPMVGWMAGYLGWLAGATDNAIYPVLFLDYIVTAISGNSAKASLHPVLRFIGIGITSISLSYINWLGLDIVGNMSVLICCVAMSPFVIMTCVGILHMDFSRLFEVLPPNEQELLWNVTDDDVDGGFFPAVGLASTGVLWRPFLNNLFWNLNSFDAAAAFAADVGDHPERVIPTAMMSSVVMVALSYLLPLSVAIGATTVEPYQWTDGYLGTIAGQIAGPWLEGWTIFAAGISNIAMFQAELSADSFQLMGMSERGHVPELFSRRSRHGTPTYSIILQTIIIVTMGTLGLDKLVALLNLNYSISLLMELSAFIKLRISRPDLPRPWKIPFNTVGCILFFTPTYIIVILILALSNFESFIFTGCTLIVGALIYFWKHGLHRMLSWRFLCTPSLWISYDSLSSSSSTTANHHNSSTNRTDHAAKNTEDFDPTVHKHDFD